jgi:coenzyme F420-dependent glucose-6-phosphate dehydrogenase
LRYHPAVIAQAAATVAALAPGRAFLGVGTGEALNEYSATAKWPAYKRRQAQMAEAIELIRALWSGKKITHKGAHYQTREAKLYTLPQEPIPLYVSTMVPNSARFAGQLGDGLITVGGEEPETYGAIFDKFEAGARAAGKDPGGMPRMIEVGVAYTDNKAEALECKRAYWAGTFVSELFTEKIFTPQMSEEKGKQVSSETITESLCISADPDDHVQFAQRYIDIGFNQIIFHCAGPDQKGFLENYGRDVLPRLRATTRSAAETAGGTTRPDTGFIDEHNP